MKGTRKKSEKMEKRGKEDKQGRQDALASQHAFTSAFISAEHPLIRGRSPLHTAFNEKKGKAVAHNQHKWLDSVAVLVWH